MDNIQANNRTFERRAWAAFAAWWEISQLFQLPLGTWVLGFGLILIALNAARLLSGLPISGFTITAGILALLLGLDTGKFFPNLPFELPVFPILLIVLGVIVLARSLTGSEAKTQGA
jgi:hypothetical protein